MYNNEADLREKQIFKFKYAAIAQLDRATAF